MPRRGRKLYADEAAAMVGVKPGTWRDYCTPVARRGGRRIGPEPDGIDIERGHARPYWWESTVLAFKENRAGRGARTDLTRD